MTGQRTLLWIACVASAAPAGAAAGDVVLETDAIRVTISDDAKVTSIQARGDGRELLANGAKGAEGPPAAAFVVHTDKGALPAEGVKLTSGQAGTALVVRFPGVVANFKLVQTPTYAALTLESLQGEGVRQIDLLRLRVRPLPHRGTWIDVLWDDSFGLCLCGGNIRTNAGMAIAKDAVTMTASAYAQTGLKGSTAVLLACQKPAAKFLDAMEIVERDFQMPPGARNRRSAIQSYSYLWATPTPADIGQYVQWAKRGGFRTVLLSYTAFGKGVGHFEWNARYPGGMGDLKKVTGAIRDAGLAVGLHIHYNKALKSDPYVTPVPDDRLHKLRTFTLQADVDEKATVLPVRENPRGCTTTEGMRILQVGKELISYERYTTHGPFEFQGCRRGDLKTHVAAHRAGQKAHLLDVDTWPAFIRFDQDTDIQDEAAARIAAIVKETGPYDMVYFDGAEDVHSPFWYHCANAQWRVWKRLDPPPPVAEAAANTHFSWHMMSRSNAFDSVAPDQMKEFCRKNPCRVAARRADDFTRIDFGWLHGFGRSPESWIGPDVLEYVLGRGAAWDCPFSLSLRLPEIRNNLRAEDCLDVTRIWEDARIGGKLTDAQRKELGMLEHEHHLFVDEDGKLQLVRLTEIPGVAGALSASKHLKAYSFRGVRAPQDTYVLVWALVDRAELVLGPSPGAPTGQAPKGLRAMRPFGKPVGIARGTNTATVPVGGRMYLVFPNTPAGEVKKLLQQATSREVTTPRASR